MRSLDRRLLRTAAESKLQIMAVVVIITLALISLVVLTNVYENLNQSLLDYYERQSFAHLFAELTPQPPEYVEGLSSLREIEQAEGRVVADVRMDVGRDIYPELHLVGLPQDGLLNRPQIVEGSPPTRGEVALLTGFAEANGLQVGDEVDLIVRGEAISVEVSATASSPEFLYPVTDIQQIFAPDQKNRGIALADMGFAADILGKSGQINEASFTVAEGYSQQDAEDAVEDAMEGHGLLRVLTRDDQVSNYSVMLRMEQMEDLSHSVPVVFLAIAAVIIYMLLLRMVESDRPTIGVLKATGYTDREVLLHYLKYALAMGGAGAVLGMGIGHLLVRPVAEFVFLQFFDMPFLHVQLNWALIAVGGALTLVFCGGTGLLAARGVLRIVPADAMRPPAPPAGKRNLLEVYLPRLWDGLTFFTRLSLRQLFRNKKRFVLAVLGVAFAYTLVVLPFYLLGIVDAIAFEQYEEFEVYDYALIFDQPASESAISELRREADIGIMEPMIQYPFTVSKGWREESVPVRALPEGASLQRFENERGQRVSIPSSGILVCEYMAGALGVEPGDRIRMSSQATDEREYTVEVREVIRQTIGSVMYTSHETMQKMTGQGDAYTGALVQSPDDLRYRLREVGNIGLIMSVQQILEGFGEMMGVVIALCSILVILGGVFAFAILFNVATVGITERVREFSSMRVLGYDSKAVYRIVLHENVLATALGLLLGAPLGHMTIVAVIEAFQRTEMLYMPVPFHPVSHLFATALVCAFVAVVMGAVWFRIKNIDLLEALSARMT